MIYNLKYVLTNFFNIKRVKKNVFIDKNDLQSNSNKYNLIYHVPYYRHQIEISITQIENNILKLREYNILNNDNVEDLLKKNISYLEIIKNVFDVTFEYKPFIPKLNLFISLGTNGRTRSFKDLIEVDKNLNFENQIKSNIIINKFKL